MNRVVLQGVWADDSNAGACAKFGARSVDGFVARPGQTRIEDVDGEVVCFTGLGSRASGTAADLRMAARAGARRISRALPARSPERAAVDLVVDVDSFLNPRTAPAAALRSAVLAGASEGGYEFQMLDAVTHLSSTLGVSVRRPDGTAMQAPVLELALAHAVAGARDLVNLPASALTPTGFADRAAELLLPLGVNVARRDAAELEAQGFGGITAIGKGADNPPVLLELAFGEESPTCTFVGKGVTYDSGGLSLKPPDALMDMKSDMAGAAALVAVFSVLPQFAPGSSFRAVIALVENMPGPRSVRPGDVVVLRNGSTLEILNTDFEGRVILADSLALAAESCPAAIVDLATLTYAANHALGSRYAAMVASDERLAELLIDAGKQSGDLVWGMPLQPELEEQIRSDVADYKNFPGTAEARVSTAALFLHQFVGGIPWAHIDMAGPAFKTSADAFSASGGTGFGVRLLTEFIARGGAGRR